MHSIVDVIQNGQVFDVLLNTTLAKSVCPGFSGALCGITEKKINFMFHTEITIPETTCVYFIVYEGNKPGQ